MKALTHLLIYAIMVGITMLFVPSITHTIIIITCVSVLYAYYLVKDINPQDRLIKKYESLLNDLQKKHFRIIGDAYYLCPMASTYYPKWFQEDLRIRLSRLDQDYPYIHHIQKTHGSKYILEKPRMAMWASDDYFSREWFLLEVIQTLKDERDLELYGKKTQH